MPRVSATGRASLAFFAGTWALLAAFRTHAPLHLDTARDLLIARDCALGLHCPGAGPRSSFGGLLQGATWPRLLELREQFGWGLAALEHAADLLLACAAAVVPLVARRIGAPANALTWALWFPATLWTIGYPRLWNPTPWPLALVLTFLALLQAARSGGAVMFGLAAGALALAVDVHVAAAVMVPLAIAVASAGARRPVVALPLAAGAFVGALAWLSPGAFAENRATLAPYAAALLTGAALAVTVGLIARRWFVGDGDRRARLVAVVACVYGSVALALLSLITGHGLDPRYFAPIVTPAALVLGARGSSVLAPRWRVALLVAVVAGYIALWAVQRVVDRQFRLIEAEAVAVELYGRGLAFGDLYRHVRGPRAFDLVSTLAALEPNDGRTAGRDGLDWLIVRAPRAALPSPVPDGWQVVELGDSHVAVIVAAGPNVAIEPVEVCSDGDCMRLAVDVDRFAQGPGMQWSARAHAGLVGLPGRFAGASAVTYRLPRRTDGAPRHIVVFPDDCGRWQIDGEPGDVVVFTVAPRRRCRWWLPPFAEIDVRDLALASLVASAGADSPQ